MKRSVPCKLSTACCHVRSVCVWGQTSEFCTILPDKLITGDIKIFVQNKIFSRPTDQTFWAVCNLNQTITLSRPYKYFWNNMKRPFRELMHAQLRHYHSRHCLPQHTVRLHVIGMQRAGKFPGILETFHGKFREFWRVGNFRKFWEFSI